MPIYEYLREDGQVIDLLKGMNDPDPTHDPDTGLKIKRTFLTPPTTKVFMKTMDDGSKMKDGMKVSERHLREIKKRKYKRSDKAKHEDGDAK